MNSEMILKNIKEMDPKVLSAMVCKALDDANISYEKGTSSIYFGELLVPNRSEDLSFAFTLSTDTRISCDQERYCEPNASYSRISTEQNKVGFCKYSILEVPVAA